jgi:hypothetical protein
VPAPINHIIRKGNFIYNYLLNVSSERMSAGRIYTRFENREIRGMFAPRE